MDVVYVGMSDDMLAVTPKNIREEYELTANDFVVLTVGRLVKRKGVDDLIRAIKEIGDESIKLMVVGEGEEKENLKRLAEELGVNGQVIFTGRVESVADFYHSADVFSMPSKFLEAEGDIEGLGIVYLEAQYFGLPVIGTRSGGIPEALDEGSTGYLVAEGDVGALAEKILYLKNNPQEYERMSGLSKKFVQDKFGWETIIKQMMGIYIK
jgi:phosphatidylinositol alpha-1,6-mannosyltransferase